ncbi:unannotated protein [freshwater metagenome]|uniref:Unannotated protein n=1 Tax=freshwater metagenome TaxID=449393 RepID=A0A6J7VQF8_9ZZZZ
MTPSQKPEWIEIADKDKSVFPRKVSKGLPVMALVVTASILGIGSIFAQTADEVPASAVEISAPAVQSSQSAEPSAAGATQSFAVQTSNAPKQANTANASFAPQSTSAVSPSAPTMKNPSIGTMPTGGGDDDDDDEDEGDDDDEDEGDDD